MSNPIVVKNREQLIFMLSEASMLEHMVMCQYLYASFSLKGSTTEGITEAQVEAIRRWDRTITEIAQQEMLHLSLVNNLLVSIGAAPYFERPNFPVRSRYFPSRVRLALMPIDEVSLKYFLYLERPETMAIEDVPGFVREGGPASGELIVPEGEEFATIGQLYRGIEQGFGFLVESQGEKGLFIGSSESQATSEHFFWPELIAVSDLGSARQAIETIVTEGEGARGDWKNAHFGKFVKVLEEYKEFKKADPNFSPSRPALAAYSRLPSDTETAELINDELTSKVSDLFNASYEVLLQTLGRFYLQVETSGEERRRLSDLSIRLMRAVIKPLGALLTTLPIGKHRPGMTAGPTFEMFPISYILPESKAAWTILHERTKQLTGFCSELSRRSDAPRMLVPIEKSLNLLAKSFESD